MRRAVAAALLAGALAASAAAAPPAWVDEALRLGSSKTPLDPYGVPGLPVTFTTPFQRVARAANKAFREGRTLGAAEVDPRAWVPELRLLVGAIPIMEGGRVVGTRDPRAVRFLLGAGEVKPSRMDRSVETQSFSPGGKPTTFSGGLLKAVFEVRGRAPARGTLEIRYVRSRDGREEETVERVPLDFRTYRW
jgi:hypothetical protein